MIPTNYNVTKPGAYRDTPIANVWLADDGAGSVDIMINDYVVAFFNSKGELWLVNFTENNEDGIGELQRAGIRFERSKDDDQFFTVKMG